MGLFSNSGTGGQSFLRRLGKDKAGNVIAMTAAAAFPMIGVVGGAIDASRMYMVTNRLQAACDSAVLAGRKAMEATSYDTTARNRANAMFNFNFKNRDFQTTGTSFLAQADANGKLTGTASTTIPMMLMQVFGFESQHASVTCSADIQIPNIDVVFVLDVTGSMDEEVNGKKKIDALKDSVKAFYSSMQTRLGTSGQNRIRYGFVPYSQTVNVKELFTNTSYTTNGMARGEASLDNIASTIDVESRVANFAATGSNAIYGPDPDSTPVSYTQMFSETAEDSRKPFKDSSASPTPIESTPCSNYGNNIDTGYDRQLFFFFYFWAKTAYFYPHTAYDPSTSPSVLYATSLTDTTATTTAPNTATYYRITFARVAGSDTNVKANCTRRVTWTKYKQTSTPTSKFANYTYKKVPLDVSSFKAGNTISYVTKVSTSKTISGTGSFNMLEMTSWTDQSGLTKSTTKWDGCIEERDTVAATNFAPIPANAYDLNYLLPGNSTQTRWRPIIKDLMWYRGGPAEVTTTDDNLGHSTDWRYDLPTYACPAASIRNLAVWTQSDFNAYVNTLSPNGFTYLDVGMVWGLRLISPQGMFGYRNLTGTNGGQISRHIIFLTDGYPVSAGDSVTAYGLENISKRITKNTNTDAATLHARRFQALCDAQRGAVTIWAIALGTSVTGNMSKCADPNRAYQADNATQLTDAFNAIANDIADLRLVQ